MRNLTLFLLLNLIIGNLTYAQESYKHFRHSQENTGIRGISLATGYYNPSMEYFENLGQDFKGSFSGEINFEYWIAKHIAAVRAGVGYFSSTATSDNAAFPEEFNISLIPFNIDALLYLGNRRNKYSTASPISVYMGFGTHFNLVTNNYKSPISSQSTSGKYTSYHWIFGFEYGLNHNIFIGPEIQYAIGNFNQTFLTSDDVPYVKEINMNGVKMYLVISYQF